VDHFHADTINGKIALDLARELGDRSVEILQKAEIRANAARTRE